VLPLVLGLVSCQSIDRRNHVVISVQDQEMVHYRDGHPFQIYPVSTSKYGVGDGNGSYRTPEGRLMVARKIGAGKPSGAVFKSRRWTGEVLSPNAPGRDPIVTRILWLKGRDKKNRNAFRRMIYIHGTTEEKHLGKPVSYGCIRMASADVLSLYSNVRVGTPVTIVRGGLPLKVRTARVFSGIKSAMSNTGRRIAASFRKADKEKPEES
jgi:lipoprotein-anchoring transpeptidase ErfK/SrfK